MKKWVSGMKRHLPVSVSSMHPVRRVSTASLWRAMLEALHATRSVTSVWQHLQFIPVRHSESRENRVRIKRQ